MRRMRLNHSWLAVPLVCGLLVLGLPAVSAVHAQQSATKQPAKKAAEKAAQKAAKKAVDEAENVVKGAKKAVKTTAKAVKAVAPDLSMVPPSAHAGVVLQPQILVQSPEYAMTPFEVISAGGLQEWGFDPTKLEQVTLLANLQNPQMPSVAVILRSLDPISGEVMAQSMQVGDVHDAQEGGVAYKMSIRGIGYYQASPNTLVVGAGPVFLEVVSGKKAADNSALLTRLQAAGPGQVISAVVDLEPVRQQLGMVKQMAQQVPPQLQEFTRIPELLTAVELHVGVSDTHRMELILDGKDDAAGKELNGLIDKGISQLFQAIQSQMKMNMGPGGEPDAVQVAANAYTIRMFKHAIDTIQREQDGKRVTLAIEGDTTVGVASTGVGVALLLPAVQAAREAARRSQSSNNMKQIALAMHNYHDTYNKFPADIKSADGKPLLSWRVVILPYLEQQPLYAQFKLDEPWDSAHNRPLMDQMPAIYHSPNSPDLGGKTLYLGIAGPGTLFEGKREKLTFASIKDGTSNTIGMVEADLDQAIEWTRPADLVIDFEKPMDGLGTLRPGIFNAMLLDGSIRSIANSIDVDTLKALFTIDGSEVIPNF